MLAVFLVLLSFADAAKAGLDKAELKKLQGKWYVTRMEHGGKATPAKQLTELLLEVSDGKMTTREGAAVKEEDAVVALDPRAKPAAIDLKVTSGPDAGKVVKGIYKLEGDALTVCVAEPGKERPAAFAAKEGTGLTLMAFRKAKK
jgi:uncharacterized protein (TIGR03067 family)